MLSMLTPYIFFFQAEDGIRDTSVTGVQTCALPILAAVPPQGRLDHDAVALRLDHDRRRHQRCHVAIEIFDESLDAAFVAHLLALLDGAALVGEHDREDRKSACRERVENWVVAGYGK